MLAFASCVIHRSLVFADVWSFEYIILLVRDVVRVNINSSQNVLIHVDHFAQRSLIARARVSRFCRTNAASMRQGRWR